MLAYVFWHRPAPGVGRASYEQALSGFHRSLQHRPPAGFRGSATLSAPSLRWLPGAGDAYEDWYLIDGWDALGVLESAAVAHGHATAHDRAARKAGPGAGGVYRLLEGEARPASAHAAVWVTAPPGSGQSKMAELLEDGIGARDGSLWRRCLVLGPAPELCLLAHELRAAACRERALRAAAAVGVELARRIQRGDRRWLRR